MPQSSCIVDTSRSSSARLRPVGLAAVTLEDRFWAPRRRQLREVILPEQYRLLEETGRLANFRRAAGRQLGSFQGYYFNDSDVYKWLEAVGWALADGPDAALEDMARSVVDLIDEAQGPDGYLDTYFALERAGERWTNLRDLHELYCAGHLLQAAVAWRRAQDDQRLMGIAHRLADHICATFGSRTGVPGHPEVEMALVEFARATGGIRYRAQAMQFLDARGRGHIGGRDYHLDHRPFRELERLAGHAVRALYLCAGAADLYAETGEPALRTALERLWEHMVQYQLYISGGLGARHDGESFGADYQLPNERAYAETCAAIASVMWNWRMLALDGDARYADLLETTLYNAVLPGISLDGLGYFYENPLAAGPEHRRQPWFPCACCPPNVARTIAALPGYVYSVSPEGAWVHLYATGSLQAALPGGQPIALAQQSDYPWDGTISIEARSAGDYTLFLRVPAWCAEGAALEVNGQPWSGPAASGTYAALPRKWQPGDVVTLRLPMPVRQVVAHPYVAENGGRLALLRGPLLYCAEGVDHPGVDPRDLALVPGGEYTAGFDPALLGGAVAIHGPARAQPPGAGWAGQLYRPAGAETGPVQDTALTAVPYYAWANRAPGGMQVWLRAG